MAELRVKQFQVNYLGRTFTVDVDESVIYESDPTGPRRTGRSGIAKVTLGFYERALVAALLAERDRG